ncbi:MAG: thiol:disulfide interchange protein [Idiomarinaceae bacterium HL-53]|nr:MAG: thiol:disulfide interchange protein [Idiomarinaceae bacterium HL-53]CUS47949.1 Cytochrome C biogenesis protein transmembrane region [Idiomarinaceae bacterium HL-53]
MEFTSIPLAFVAGVLSLLSPCVLPMVPAVTASSMRASKSGLWFLAAGIAVAFALGGSLFTFLLLSAGISPQLLRTGAAFFMLFLAAVLLIPALNSWFSMLMAKVTPNAPHVDGSSSASQFIVGSTLGLVWLPCVGPTLGAAIALASAGESMIFAFVVMLSFGLGTALPLLGIGYAAGKKLNALRSSGKIGRILLGISLLALALMIFSGLDHVLERWAIEHLPDWTVSI